MEEAPPRKRTVLVVDDVSVDRKILSRCLERDGYAVCMAYDGRQALQLLRAQADIDLVRHRCGELVRALSPGSRVFPPPQGE